MDDNRPTTTDAQKDSPPAGATFEPAAPLKGAHFEFEPEDEKADGAGSDAKPSGGGGIAAQATDRARQFAGQGKDRATEALGQIAKILTDAAGQVDDRLGASYGQYARQAAAGVQGFADQLSDKNVDELLEDVRELIRKSPGVAIGAAATIGFVLTRLISSGLEQRDA